MKNKKIKRCDKSSTPSWTYIIQTYILGSFVPLSMCTWAIESFKKSIFDDNNLIWLIMIFMIYLCVIAYVYFLFPIAHMCKESIIYKILKLLMLVFLMYSVETLIGYYLNIDFELSQRVLGAVFFAWILSLPSWRNNDKK